MKQLLQSIIAYISMCLLLVAWGSTAMFAVSLVFAPIQAMPYFIGSLGIGLGIPRLLNAWRIDLHHDLDGL